MPTTRRESYLPRKTPISLVPLSLSQQQQHSPPLHNQNLEPQHAKHTCISYIILSFSLCLPSANCTHQILPKKKVTHKVSTLPTIITIPDS